MNSNSPARSRELRHLELRGFLSPWTRCLKTGVVTRYNANGSPSFHVGMNPSPADKARGDASLRGMGFPLLDIPGGCQIERES